jgi:hypothetical protein
MTSEEMRLECARLHQSHSERLKALEDYQKIQNGSLVRMADSVDALRTKINLMVIIMVTFMALALPEMVMKFLDVLFK